MHTNDLIYLFQPPISGVNDWNQKPDDEVVRRKTLQSPISGVNDWNGTNPVTVPAVAIVSVSYQRS